jgi:hypothetical protein
MLGQNSTFRVGETDCSFCQACAWMIRWACAVVRSAITCRSTILLTISFSAVYCWYASNKVADEANSLESRISLRAEPCLLCRLTRIVIAEISNEVCTHCGIRCVTLSCSPLARHHHQPAPNTKNTAYGLRGCADWLISYNTQNKGAGLHKGSTFI